MSTADDRGPPGQVRVTLSRDALAVVELRDLANLALDRQRGALVGCGAVERSTVGLMANVALGRRAPIFFSALPAPEGRAFKGRKAPLFKWVSEFQRRGHWCPVLEPAALAATLPADPFPTEISFLYLAGESLEPLLNCLRALEPQIGAVGLVVVDGLGDPEARAAIAQSLDQYGFERLETSHGPWRSAWTRPKPELPGPGETRSKGKREDSTGELRDDAYIVLSYPDPVAGKFAKVCRLAGFQTTRDLSATFDLAIKWLGETYTPRDAVLEELAAQTRVLNLGCEDISKTAVEELHRTVFGYGALVDPLTYEGRCVKKTNLNARCEESVVDCPIAEAELPPPGIVVYQRLIVTAREPEEFEEYRVAITGPEIPYVVIKRRPLQHRFDRSAGYALIRSPEQVFSDAERAKIIEMVTAAKLDFGDLDILRDREDGRIHVIDINPTPGGPGGGYTEEQRQELIGKQLAALRRVFIA